MQSTEAGLCGPKLQSAPEISKGDDQEHILYCPECAARLRLTGVKPVEPSPITVRNDSTRKTLPDFLSEPNPVPVVSRVETRHDGFLPLAFERRESASRLPVVAESRESAPRLPLPVERHDSASRLPVVAERRQSALQTPMVAERKESVPRMPSAAVVDIDAANSVDDDEPTRVIRNSEVLAEVRAELSAQPSTIIVTNNVAPILEDEPTPPLKSQTVSVSVAQCTDAAATEVDVKVPDSLEKIQIEFERIPQSTLSDAPITHEVTSVSVRSKRGKYRPLAIGVSAAALVLVGAFVTRGKITGSTKEQKSLAVSSVGNQVLNVPRSEDVPTVPVQPIQEPVTQNVVVPESSAAPRTAKSKSSQEISKLSTPLKNVKPTEAPLAERSSDPISKESTLPKKETTKKETTSEEVEGAAPTTEPREAVFDAAAAASALDDAASRASSCRQPSDPSGVAVVTITFASSGRVTTATISGPPFVGTATGSCIAAAMRTAKVPTFSGQFKTVKKTVTIN